MCKLSGIGLDLACKLSYYFECIPCIALGCVKLFLFTWTCNVLTIEAVFV